MGENVAGGSWDSDTAHRFGPLMPATACLSAARLLVDLAGSHPEHLTLAVARHVKRRVK